MTKIRPPLPYAVAVGALVLVALALVTPAAAGEKTAGATAPQNLSAIHDPLSRAYDGNCLKCHANILKEGSGDPRLLAFHQAMLPYVPGYNARKGAQNKHCQACHTEAIDFHQESGVSLRRTVNIESCFYCHGRSGPGPKYYE